MQKGYLCFLDLKIPIVDYKFETTVYSKPTNSFLCLQSNSCHNPKIINGIQRDLALRIRNICSSNQHYLEKLKEYMSNLVASGHAQRKIKRNSKCRKDRKNKYRKDGNN